MVRNVNKWPNRYPVYVPTKGRWQYERRMTLRAFERMGLDFYYAIVEDNEHDAYASALGSDARLLVLPQRYKDEYEYAWQPPPELSQSPGPGAARNFAWDHAAEHGHARHWTVDDNIRAWYRFHRNKRVPVGGAVAFRVLEDWADQYLNVAMCGPHYTTFVHDREQHDPITFNTRVYSCNLIQTDAPFRWRGQLNEDTILSLDMLEAGWCTALFCSWLIEKKHTQVVQGGNTAEFYAKDGTWPKSDLLVKLFPHVCKHSRRWGRDHHFVDYRRYRGNRLERNPNAEPLPDYGLTLRQREGTRGDEQVAARFRDTLGS